MTSELVVKKVQMEFRLTEVRDDSAFLVGVRVESRPTPQQGLGTSWSHVATEDTWSEAAAAISCELLYCAAHQED